jgi:hypothetical protein
MKKDEKKKGRRKMKKILIIILGLSISSTAVCAGLYDGGGLFGFAPNQNYCYVVAASNAPSKIKAAADFVCDGVDDQVEINAAYAVIQTLISDTMGYTGTHIGGKIQLSAGVFNCSAPIVFDGPAPVSIEGVGFQSRWPSTGFRPAGTVVRCADQMNNYLMMWTGDINHADPNGWSGGFIRGIWFEGNGAQQTYGSIHKDLSLGISIGIFIYNRGDTYIENCMFHGFRHDFAVLMMNHGSWITGCDLVDNYGGDLCISGGRYFIYSNHFARNGAYLGRSSILSWTRQAKIIGNNFDDVGGKIIDGAANSDDMIISHNTFNGWAKKVSIGETAIYLRNGQENVVISGNIFNGKSGTCPYAYYGIYSGSSDAIVRAVISGNAFENTAAENINLAGTLTQCSIADNVGPGAAAFTGDKTNCNIHDNNFAGNTTISGTATNCNIHDNK